MGDVSVQYARAREMMFGSEVADSYILSCKRLKGRSLERGKEMLC